MIWPTQVRCVRNHSISVEGYLGSFMSVKFNKNNEQILFHFYSVKCWSGLINFKLCSKEEMVFK